MAEYLLSAQVAHARKSPIRKSLPRLEARRCIPIYQACAFHDRTLLKFSKLDFNLLQHQHKKEIREIFRWWKDLDFANKLPFARDRLVEGYLWILGVYFEPQFSLARRMVTKGIAITSIIDDIYDAYSTFEELELFSSAIERWDMSCIDQLPDYMKLCYRALLDVYEEMEEMMTEQRKLYRVQYAKEAFHENYAPTLEEYMSVALITSGYRMLPITSYVGMGDDIMKEAFNWASNTPKSLQASMTLGRLMDDIASHKFEQEKGHVGSAVECYMKQHGVSEQEAYNEFHTHIDNARNDINEEMLNVKAILTPVLIRILNFSRVIDVLYKDGEDRYTNVVGVARSGITSLLIDPISV
ncbi:hypothetical protein QUC31_001912 [Theobroma cacao]